MKRIAWFLLGVVLIFFLVWVYFILIAIMTLMLPFSKKARHLWWQGATGHSFSETIDKEVVK